MSHTFKFYPIEGGERGLAIEIIQDRDLTTEERELEMAVNREYLTRLRILQSDIVSRFENTKLGTAPTSLVLHPALRSLISRD